MLGWFAADPSRQDGERLLWAHAEALAIYTMFISLLARHEAGGGKPGVVLAWFPCLAPFVTLFGWTLREVDAWTWATALLTAVSVPLGHWLIPDIAERVAERIAGLILLDYVAWRLIASGFAEGDWLAKGGMLLVVLYGTALVLRRLMPST